MPRVKAASISDRFALSTKSFMATTPPPVDHGHMIAPRGRPAMGSRSIGHIYSLGGSACHEGTLWILVDSSAVRPPPPRYGGGRGRRGPLRSYLVRVPGPRRTFPRPGPVRLAIGPLG